MIASIPREGPTSSACTISAEAGNLPALKTLAKSTASLIVNCPEISELPPDIGPVVTPGAEYTMSSRTMAICPRELNALPVISSQIFAPLAFICMDTEGLPVLL